jgi:alpha-ketoglutarate-dependent taurine dioxygenase
MASAAEKISTISVTKLHPIIGAEIGGVDLRYPLDDETIRQIKQRTISADLRPISVPSPSG